MGCPPGDGDGRLCSPGRLCQPQNPTKSSPSQNPHPCCLLSQLQAGQEVVLGTQQGHLLKDTLLDLGHHQPHQHGQGGGAHVKAGSVGEVFLQVVKGTWRREKLLEVTRLVRRRVRLRDQAGTSNISPSVVGKKILGPTLAI